VDDEPFGFFPNFGKKLLLFDLNANPERAAFPATVRRGGSHFTRNSLGGTIQ
jgi:hypothetical protein